MFPTAKIATLSAVLTSALLFGFSAEGARSTLVPSETVKPFQDRILQDAVGAQPIVLAYASAGAEAGVATSRSQTKSDRLKAEPSRSCADQAWPYISRDCLAAAEGAPVRKVSRTVTIEQRQEPNTSTLVKGGALAVASR